MQPRLFRALWPTVDISEYWICEIVRVTEVIEKTLLHSVLGLVALTTDKHIAILALIHLLALHTVTKRKV